MYRIIGYLSPTTDEGHMIFNPRMGYNIIDGSLTLVENEIDHAEITVGQENWLYGKTGTFNLHINIYQGTSDLIFRGRLLEVNREMKDDGTFQQKFTFEGIGNYLRDSIQRYKKVQNTTPRQFLQDLINHHNSQVPAYKQFVLRNVEVTNSTDNVYRYVDYTDTWTTIKDKLLSRLGGIIQTSHNMAGTNYIDYIQYNSAERTHVHDDNIVIGRNMKSLSNQEDPTEVITRLIPLGATIQSETVSEDTDAANPRVTIADVNNGKDYIDIPDLQEQFGIINGTHVWEDVHKPNILLTKAKRFIANQAAVKNTYTISAVKLPNYNQFYVSHSYLVKNERIMVSKQLRVIQKDIDFNNPYLSTLTIGNRKFSLSRYQLDTANAEKQAQAVRDRFNANHNDLVALQNDYSKVSNQIKEIQDKVSDVSNRTFITLTNNQKSKPASWYADLATNQIKGAFVLLTAGTSNINRGFATEVTYIKGAGMKFIGAFHKISATDEKAATQEAQFFLSKLQENNVNTSALVACYIGDGNLSTDKAVLDTVLSAFYSVLVSAGYINTVDYANASWFNVRFTSKAKFKWVVDTTSNNIPIIAGAWEYNNNFNNEGLQISKSFDKSFV